MFGCVVMCRTSCISHQVFHDYPFIFLLPILEESLSVFQKIKQERLIINS